MTSEARGGVPRILTPEECRHITPKNNPAKWSDPILDRLAPMLSGIPKVLDCFGGTGKLGHIKSRGFSGEVVMNDLEPEWACQGYENGCDVVMVGDSLLLGEALEGEVPAIATSPTYGNRMADCHEAKDKSRRMTYRHQLGRMPSAGSSSVLQWGKKYKAFHLEAWPRIFRLLSSGGLFILNCSGHIRGGTIARVSQWHAMVIKTMGMTLLDWQKVETQRMGFGENGKARVDHEDLIIFRKD